MPKKPARTPLPDANTRIVRAVNRLTDSEPVRGEDLLPPRLAKKLREAKAQEINQQKAVSPSQRKTNNLKRDSTT